MPDGWDTIHTEPAVVALMGCGIDRPHILRIVSEPGTEADLTALVAEIAGTNAKATMAALDAQTVSLAHCRALLGN